MPLIVDLRVVGVTARNAPGVRSGEIGVEAAGIFDVDC